MAKQTEKSFGAQLRKAQEYLGYISEFVGYAPARQEESVAGFRSLIDDARNSNTTVALAQQEYQMAVRNRKNAFKGGPSTIDKYIIQIKASVESQYGTTGSESQIINQIISNMRSSSKSSAASTAKTTEGENGVKKVSRSKRSYGSQIQYFDDVIATLGSFPDYYSPNEILHLPYLQSFSEKIWILHSELTSKTKHKRDATVNRKALYKELEDRIQRIKKYVKAKYGPDSNEYNQIKNL